MKPVVRRGWPRRGIPPGGSPLAAGIAFGRRRLEGLTLESTLLALGREAVLVVLVVSAPPLLAALAVGIATGVLQAATQVQEPSIGVAPRLAAVLLALGLAGPWIGARVARFAATCIELFERANP